MMGEGHGIDKMCVDLWSGVDIEGREDKTAFLGCVCEAEAEHTADGRVSFGVGMV